MILSEICEESNLIQFEVINLDGIDVRLLINDVCEFSKMCRFHRDLNPGRRIQSPEC